MTEHHQTHEQGDRHDEIMLPSPNFGPAVAGVGIMLIALGIVPAWRILLPVGGIVLAIGAWMSSARSRHDLAVDEHLEAEADRRLPRVDLRKLGMWIFLVSEVMFFSALISTYLTYRLRPEFNKIPNPHYEASVEEVAVEEEPDPALPEESVHAVDDIAGAEDIAHKEYFTAQETLNLPMAALNTFLLLVSSFTAANAMDALAQGKRNIFRNMLLVTFVLGAIFLGIQALEWFELYNHYGVTPDTLFGTAFYTTTGFHGLHVTIGLAWLLFILARVLFQGAYRPEDSISIEVFGLYWHFVDIIWIILFTLIYLIN